MNPRRVTTMPANDRLSGDELVLHIIQRMARGELPSELIDPAPHHHRLDHDPHPAGVGLLQIIDGPFTATLDHLTTKPVPMDRDTQIRNYHYDTHTAVLDLYGALYDARTTHPWTVRCAQAHRGCGTAMKHARAVCTGEAASLQDSFMVVAEGVQTAMDKAADTLNKLVNVFNDDEDEKGDFDYEQDV